MCFPGALRTQTVFEYIETGNSHIIPANLDDVMINSSPVPAIPLLAVGVLMQGIKN